MDIYVDGLTAGYQSNIVLSDIDLKVESGAFAGLVGPNGSGKTTLLRCLSRTLTPLSGTVKIGGEDIHHISARSFARDIAVVTQEITTAFDFTVMEVALMGRSPRMGRFQTESKKDREIAEYALERTGTLHLADRFATRLSGGERQRVMIARALCQMPKVMLLDEPTSFLDINFQHEIMEVVKSLNGTEGLTVLAVLHDLNLASAYCDTITMIADGSVKHHGPPEETVTENNLREVYGVDVIVGNHPHTSRPYVLLSGR